MLVFGGLIFTLETDTQQNDDFEKEWKKRSFFP